jgi:hypothetical protein
LALLRIFMGKKSSGASGKRAKKTKRVKRKVYRGRCGLPHRPSIT